MDLVIPNKSLSIHDDAIAPWRGTGLRRNYMKLINNADEVICLDNLCTGKKSNIEDLINNNNFRFITHDVTSPVYLEVDRIFNLACPASPKHYQFDPVQTIKSNVHGAINMLSLAKLSLIHI